MHNRLLLPLVALSLLTIPLNKLQAEKKQYIEWNKKSLQEIYKRSKQVTKEEDWYKLESKNYFVETQVDEEFTAALSLYMDFIYLHLTKIFKFPLKNKTKPKVMIAKDQATYRQLIQSEKDESRGYFKWRYTDGGKFWPEFTLYSYIEFPHERDFQYFYLPILNHEGAHQIVQMQSFTTSVSPFINEGLATFIQYWQFQSKSNKERNSRSEQIPYAKKALAEGTLPTLQELLAIKGVWSIDNYGPKTRVRYGAAESFVAFLLESDVGRKYLGKVYQAAIEGEDLEKKMAKFIAKLDKAWRDYLKDL